MAALALASSLSVLAGCWSEPEVTTELSDEGSDELAGAAGAPSNPDDASAEAGSSGGRASPMGAGSNTTPSEVEAPAPMELTMSLDVPASEHCAAVADWDPAWVQFEEEVLLLVNQKRAKSADCGEEGDFPAAKPVVMDATLRCSARLHSLDMFERAFFDHTNPDGADPFERMGAAGFKGSGAGENIAVGQTSPAQVMQSWMDSDDHCANVMRGNYALLGVGYHPGAGGRGLGSNFWTQNFGAPPRSCTRNCR
jgi:uncharacterized protein YkwD